MVVEIIYGYTFDIPLRSSSFETMATDTFPQTPSRQFSYVGMLEQGKWLSVIQASLNNNNPCVVGEEAAHEADNIHSGVIQANETTKMVTVPQADPSTVLNISGLYAICYAQLNGESTDTSWRDSYIRLQISKIEALQSSLTYHTTRATWEFKLPEGTVLGHTEHLSMVIFGRQYIE
jgi:hypothetical protein